MQLSSARLTLRLPHLVVLLVVGSACWVLGQGTLTPPGAPAPTMKTLDQVECRTPLPGGVAPITISAPGSYYLTGNLTIASGDAITITAVGVTLDLGGFTVASTANPAAGTAVRISARRATVYNGVVSGAGTVSGATFSGAGFANGVIWTGSIPQSITVRDVMVTGCSAIGIKASLVERCILQNIGTTGITGTMVRECQVDPCGGIAIFAQVGTDCVGAGYTGGISGGCLTNCQGTLNGNSGSGINCSVAQNCVGSAFGTGGTGVTCANALNSSGITYGNDGAGVSCATAVGCQGTAGAGSNSTGLLATAGVVGGQGTGDSGKGMQTVAAVGCQAQSNTSVGLNASNTDACKGVSTNNDTGLYASTAVSSEGTSTTGVGFYSVVATASRGTSTSGIGLKVSDGSTCLGSTSTGSSGVYGNILVGSEGGVSGGNGVALIGAYSVSSCLGIGNGGDGIDAPIVIGSYGRTLYLDQISPAVDGIRSPGVISYSCGYTINSGNFTHAVEAPVGIGNSSERGTLFTQHTFLQD